MTALPHPLAALASKAIAILRENRAELDTGAASLLAHETLSGDNIPKPRRVPQGEAI